MKKILYTLFLSFFITLTWAQKATQQDLQGKWKLVTYAVSGAILDIETGKATVAETDNALQAAMGVKLKADMESYAEGLRMSELEISGNNFYQVIADFARNGPFTITEKDGQQYISASFDNGTTDSIPFKIIEGKLVLQNTQGNKQYVYSKL